MASLTVRPDSRLAQEAVLPGGIINGSEKQAMNDVLTLILAVGVSLRLFPLIAHRAKSAVPFGGQ